MDTFSEADKNLNNGLANGVLTAIALVRKYPDSDIYIERLALSLKDFVTGVKIPAITAKITAIPAVGNAPFFTTLRAMDARDPSGVPIPDTNYEWYLKTPAGGKTQVQRGTSVGYRFTEEGTYTINLVISSASRNSKGKIDVSSFTGTQEIKVSPKLANVILFINGANVSLTDKIKVTPNQARSGLIIDASSSTAAQ